MEKEDLSIVRLVFDFLLFLLIVVPLTVWYFQDSVLNVIWMFWPSFEYSYVMAQMVYGLWGIIYLLSLAALFIASTIFRIIDIRGRSWNMNKTLGLALWIFSAVTLVYVYAVY